MNSRSHLGYRRVTRHYIFLIIGRNFIQSELLKRNKTKQAQPSGFLEWEGASYYKGGGVSRGQMAAMKNCAKETLAWGGGRPQQLLRSLPGLVVSE